MWLITDIWRLLYSFGQTPRPLSSTHNSSDKLKVVMVAWDCVDNYVFTSLTDFSIKVWRASDGKLMCILKVCIVLMICGTFRCIASTMVVFSRHCGLKLKPWLWQSTLNSSWYEACRLFLASQASLQTTFAAVVHTRTVLWHTEKQPDLCIVFVSFEGLPPLLFFA